MSPWSHQCFEVGREGDTEGAAGAGEGNQKACGEGISGRRE